MERACNARAEWSTSAKTRDACVSLPGSVLRVLWNGHGGLQEFKRNLKREYAKLLLVVQAYALISTGVRLICSNQVQPSPSPSARRCHCPRACCSPTKQTLCWRVSVEVAILS